MILHTCMVYGFLLGLYIAHDLHASVEVASYTLHIATHLQKAVIS